MIEQNAAGDVCVTPESRWPRSVCIIGAGGTVGSTTAFALALGGLCDDLYLVDAKENLARAHAIDITEAQTLAGRTLPRLQAVRPSSASVDLLIVAASRRVPRDGVRGGAASPNVELMRDVAPDAARLLAPEGLVLLLSNPVDILAAVFADVAGVDPRRVFGYNINDSVRFRRALARELDVSVAEVQAMVLGEHGKHQVPLFSTVLVAGRPVVLSPEQQARVREELSMWFPSWSALEPGRSSGWCTATGVASLVRRARDGANVPLAVWAGDAGLPASFVTLPSRFDGSRFIADIDGVPPDDRHALAEAARAVAGQTEKALELLRTG